MIVQHPLLGTKLRKRVWFSGSTAVKRGMGLCYDLDYYTAETGEAVTDGWEKRSNTVQAPATTNNLAFAGVAAQTYAAVSGGQWIEIFEPGSVCDVLIGADTTIGSTELLCGISGEAGRFCEATRVRRGRGAALALQTNASGVIASSVDGSATVALTAIAKTGLFASAAAGDRVLILASVTSAGAAGATPGLYTLASVTDDDNAVLTASAGTGDIACLVLDDAEQYALAYLYDGEETGLCEWIAPLNNAATAAMVGGHTEIMAGVTLASGDATHTLADGTFLGQKKSFHMNGALTTQDYLVTVTTSPEVATVEMDADGDEILLEWRSALGWEVVQAKGAYTVAMAAGAGIVGTAEMVKSWIVKEGEIIKTSILIDLTGLTSKNTAGDIIGEDDGPGVAYIGQITAAKNGTIFAGKCTSLELPASGDDDIMLYSATEGTGVEDGAIGNLTETQLCDPAAAWATGLVKGFAAVPAANEYLYLVSNGDTAGTYTAGKLLIEMWGA